MALARRTLDRPFRGLAPSLGAGAGVVAGGTVAVAALTAWRVTKVAER